MVGKVKPRTVQNYIREYERCKSYIGHIKVNQLQPTYIQKMVNELFKKDIRGQRLNNQYPFEENFVNKEFDKIREKM